MNKIITLFNAHSVANDSPVFRLDNQTTITAVGLGPGDAVLFEVIYLSSVSPIPDCPCRLSELPSAVIDGVEPLVCPTCETQTEQRVRLTQRNNVVVLDNPQRALVRAIFVGDGLGTARVWAQPGTHTQDLTDSLRGCPPVCCEDEEQTWQENGVQRCNLETDELERQFISNCGNLEWRTVGPLNWQDTGELDCNADQTTTQKRQVNDCGDSRWVEGPAQDWRDNGQTRCKHGSQTNMEKQQVNQCGETRWVDDPASVQVWEDNGAIRCVTGSQTDTEKQQVNQCGDTRWVNGPAQVWEDVGEVRCVPGSLTDTEKKQVNQCGDVRWVAGPPQVWRDTGEYRCTSITASNPVYVLEILAQNQCGDLRWSEGVDAPWIDTGNTRPGASGYEKEQRTKCGDTRWIPDTADITWTDTGAERCKDGKVQLQQVNQHGHLQWVDTTRNCVSPEYFASLPLPGCGGLAYRPGDARDPAATVELQEDCDPPVTIGYLYPEPREGARTPVIAGDCADACPDTTIVGYAVDNPSGGGAGCDGPIRVVVERAAKHAVHYIPSCDNSPNKILWDDGSITVTNQ